ncbi:radical SAM protein [Methanofollis formosanus]|uniref:Radical SAM protein n=1 Tax=Methanofollis formosanus TaxID=299308 RepID=A0A8G0ZYQ4_9EURY|nr:radical SAM protein [Methanofollis formosanus]QYZ78619.1 radical SAM protein [Methanofollis formosanus]
MIPCRQCGVRPAAEVIGLCAECLRALPVGEVPDVHSPVRKKFGLPARPPKSRGGVPCTLCANECLMGPGETGFCGLRWNEGGRLITAAPKGAALAATYYDPLPTNCCAAWFCQGSGERGSNLAVFFYGCNFDCLFCQNASHKRVCEAPTVREEDMVEQACAAHVRCVCFFGGSPEPQLPFALRVAGRVVEESENSRHICWEWNGCGHPALVRRAARLSAASGGTVKFDLKAYHPNIGYALSGVGNRRAYENFAMVAREVPEKEVLTATTLLVPSYVDEKEVTAIARFIAAIDPEIPYSLLVFHPDFAMADLPITPRSQVAACERAAKRYLSRVEVGNRHLLMYAGD